MATAFLMVFLSFHLKAQTGHRDSIIKIAIADAKNFRLGDADMKDFRKNRRHLAADYFNPTITAASDTALLKDSVYVQTYRQTAYKKTRKRRTVAHHVLMGIIAMDAIFLVLLLSALASGKNVR